MNGFEFLDLVIGLIFIYLIYSIGASTIWEFIVNISQLRGKMLRTWIIENFDELNSKGGSKKKNSWKNQIIDHDLVKGLSKKHEGKPVYISSQVFTDVIVDLVYQSNASSSNPVTGLINLQTFRDNLEKTKSLPDGLKRVFLHYVDDASGSLQKVKDKIGVWYDEAQERLIGSYKKNLQIWILIISLVLAGSTNADTINLISYLYNNDEAREAIANKASLFIQDSSFVNLISRTGASAIDSASDRKQEEIVKILDKDVKVLSSLNDELKQTGIPIGWRNEDLESLKLHGSLLKKIGGILLTALAVSMGSPFWFDILSKLSNLRSTGNKPKPAVSENAGTETKK